MDRFDAMRVFVGVVERRGFASTAREMGLPRSSVTEAVQQMEANLGVRLLERTTRSVTPTDAGEAFYERCVAILAAIEEAEAAVSGAAPRGILRVGVDPVLLELVLLPALPGFLAANPDLAVHVVDRGHVGGGDRGDRVDCALVAGDRVADQSGAVQVGELRVGTFASPGYLGRHGTPVSPDDLDGHRQVGLLSARTGLPEPLGFQTPDGHRSVTLGAVAVADTLSAALALARRGLGLVQAPHASADHGSADATLIEVLEAFAPSPMAVHLVAVDAVRLPPKARAFADWLRGDGER